MKPVLVARLVGWTSVLAMLLLSSPGVRVVRADEPSPISAVPAASTCSEAPLGSSIVSISLPSAEEATDRQRERDRPEVVTLNAGGDGHDRVERAAPPPAR